MQKTAKAGLIVAGIGAAAATTYALIKRKPAPQCNVDADCPEGYACISGRCVKIPSQCSVDQDCPDNYQCIGGICILKTGVKYHCEYCGDVFDTPEELAEHIRTVHSQPNPFACPYCDEKFAYAVDLATHIALAHPTDPPVDTPPEWPVRYVCPYCQQESATMTGLFSHVSSVHEGSTPSGCATLLLDTQPVKAEVGIGGPSLGITPVTYEMCDLPYPLAFRVAWHRVAGYYEPRNLCFFMIPGVQTKILANYTPWEEEIPQLKPDSFLKVKTSPLNFGFYVDGGWQSFAPQTIVISSQWVWTVTWSRYIGYWYYPPEQYDMPQPVEVISKPGETVEITGVYVPK